MRGDLLCNSLGKIPCLLDNAQAGSVAGVRKLFLQVCAARGDELRLDWLAFSK